MTVFNPRYLAGLASILALAFIPLAVAQEAELQKTIAALDGEVFDAFNHCAEPGQLDRHAAWFDPKVEFYHDTGGVTWDRDTMLANTSRYVCGRFTRQLVPGSLKVFPVRDFGAISQGVHRFCQADSDACEGEAEFTMLWRLQDGRWQITRVLSYGHRRAATK